MAGAEVQRTLLGEVIGALGVGGVTALLLLVGYGIGWLVCRCVENDEAPR